MTDPSYVPPKKTFVYYSGQARTFASCFPNQFWTVLRHLPDPEFFVCIGNDEQAKSMELLEKRFPKEKIHYQYPFQPTFPEAEFLEDKNLHSGYPRSAPVLNVLRAFWFYQEVWKMSEGYPRGQALHVRIRPDIWFTEFTMPKGPILPTDCYSAPWGSFSGINDRFALMGHQAAKGYFTTLENFGKLMEMGAPIHPETLTKASVELAGGICHQTLLTDYRTRRLADPNHKDVEKRTGEWYQFDPVGAFEMLKASLTQKQ